MRANHQELEVPKASLPELQIEDFFLVHFATQLYAFYSKGSSTPLALAFFMRFWNIVFDNRANFQSNQLSLRSSIYSKYVR